MNIEERFVKLVNVLHNRVAANKLSEKEAIDYFTPIAELLFNECVLVAKDKKYRLAEIEFYLCHEIDEGISNHYDGSVHKDSLQLITGKWYFHQKGGSRNGLDITFGYKSDNNKNRIYGGILIRALQTINNDYDYIYGPSNVVSILTGSFENKQEFIKDINISIFNPINELNIQEFDYEFKDHIYNSARIRLLNLANNFNEAEYRFLIYPHKKHEGVIDIMQKLHYKNMDKGMPGKESMDEINNAIRYKLIKI